VETTVGGEDIWTGQLHWTGESEQSIRDVLERASERESERIGAKDAAEWLVEYLKASEGGKAATKELIAHAQQAGHSRTTLYRARLLVGIQIEYTGRVSYWKLSAEPGRSHPFHSSHVPRHGPSRTNETPTHPKDPEALGTDGTSWTGGTHGRDET
jgi:hypothetical protein